MPSTAGTAEHAEKFIEVFLGDLCVLGGKK